MTLGNNLIEGTTFNNRLQPVQIKLGTVASPSSALQLDYTYGVRVNNVLDVTKNNGNVERQTISFTGLNAQQSYTYDELNRLKMMSELGGWSQTYSYDRFGNRWVSAGNVPSPQQTPQTQSAFDALTNKINPSVMAGFGYDPVGNLTSDPTTPANGIVYDAENRQTSYTKSGVGTTTYSYDGDGRRVKKVTGSPAVTTIYVYDVMGMLVAEYNDAQQQTGEGTKYLTADHLGSTRVVTGQNQSVVARYDYLPFGEEMGVGVGSRTAQMGYGASDSTRQKFTSKERDAESGLDYFLARYYSSAQGRFTSPDEFSGGPREFWALDSLEAESQALPYADLVEPGSFNKYAYCLGNPLRYVDPDGHNPQDKTQDDEKRKAAQGAAIHTGATLTQEGRVRAEYNQRKETLNTVEERRKLQLEMRKKSTPLGKAIAEAHDKVSQAKLATKTAEEATRTIRKTNPLFNKLGAGAKVAGPALLTVGAGVSLYNIANAPEGEKVKAAVKEGSIWAGALGGGAFGAEVGSAAGPWGALAGGVIGSIVGGATGGNIADSGFKVGGATGPKVGPGGAREPVK